MTSSKLDWKTNLGLAAGKGATVQEFVATVGEDKLKIDVAPWGEGHLKINGREIARVNDAKDRRHAFHELKKIADRYLEEQPLNPESKRKCSRIPAAKGQDPRRHEGPYRWYRQRKFDRWGCAKAFRA